MRQLNKQHEVWYTGPDALETVLKDVRKFVKNTDRYVCNVDLQEFWLEEEAAFGWTATVVLDCSTLIEAVLV